MFIDLRYDIGNKERFLNSPEILKELRLLAFALFLSLPRIFFRYLMFKNKGV